MYIKVNVPTADRLTSERVREKLSQMYWAFLTRKGISYTSSSVEKDLQQTRKFYRMPLHDKTNSKCQRVFTIFHQTKSFYTYIYKAHKALVFVTEYYYLCDAGYPNAEGFLAPYRGQRYHFQEWHGVGNALTNAKEYFNIKHTLARNVIKRAFSVLMGHWAIRREKSY
ncbi:hypothetical protein IC575_021684 [Cucumis melo]